MKIALVGYGKMGHMLEQIALNRKNEIVCTIDKFASDASEKISSNTDLENAIKKANPDVIIEFTHPSSVLENIKTLLPLGIPLVVGTTGWNANEKEVAELTKKYSNVLFHAGNYSIGVNMFYRIIETAAKLMSEYEEYDVAVWEAHHNQKADSPSGTAIEIAKRIIKQSKTKNEIVSDAFHEKPKENQLHVSSTRIGATPGTHSVFFDSPVDTIELTHRVRNREGLALGAVRAAEWLYKGVQSGSLQKGKMYTMDDYLD